MIFHVLVRQDGTIWFWKFQKNVSGSQLSADSKRNAAQNLEISTLRGDISGRSAIFNCNSKQLLGFFTPTRILIKTRAATMILEL